MKLIAKQKDYYDHYCHNRSLSDQTHVWERKPAVVDIKFSIPAAVWLSNKFLLRGDGKLLSNEITACGFLVFFCGRVIPVAKVYRGSVSGEARNSYVFAFDDLPTELIKTDQKTRKWKLRELAPFPTFPEERMLALFNLGSQSWMASELFDPIRLPGHAQPSKLDLCDMHRAVGSPIFCHASGVPEVMGKDANFGWRTGEYGERAAKVIVNPLMGVMDMQKVLDPFIAFKDIERFLTNELAPRDVKRDKSIKDNPVPDKIKAESHGFDKHSFRKEPSKLRKKK